MEIILKGKLIDCDFEKWEFEGRSGVRFFGVVKDENKKLIQFKIEEEEFSTFQDLIGENINIICSIYVKGTYNLKFKEM